MLILTRRPNETITIADNIEVTVVNIKGNQVLLGIKAPKTVPVHRKEISDKLKAESGGSVASFAN